MSLNYWQLKQDLADAVNSLGRNDMDDLISEDSVGTQTLVGKSIHRQSIRQQYEAEISRMEAMIERRRKMIKLLDENSAIEQFIDLQRS